jgi:hypothetical protein
MRCGPALPASPKRKTPLPREGKGRRVVRDFGPEGYCTFRVKSSTTKEVCSELSSVPTRKTWTV